MTPFGEFLEQIRRQRHLQQKQMADVMGINPCYVSALEKGRKGPPSEKIINQLIRNLGLSEVEQAALKRSVKISELTYRLPANLSKEEFEFMYELRMHLGALSHDQLVIMKKTLKLGEHQFVRSE